MVPVISWWALDGSSYFLVGFRWFLLFPGGLSMVPVISWWALDGSCYFLVGSGWFLIFPGGLWMVPVLSWWALDGSCYFLVGSGWFLAFPGGLRMDHRREDCTTMTNTFLSHHRVAKALYQKTQLEIACPSGYCTGRRLIYRWTGSTDISTTMNVPHPAASCDGA